MLRFYGQLMQHLVLSLMTVIDLKNWAMAIICYDIGAQKGSDTFFDTDAKSAARIGLI